MLEGLVTNGLTAKKQIESANWADVFGWCEAVRPKPCFHANNQTNDGIVQGARCKFKLISDQLACVLPSKLVETWCRCKKMDVRPAIAVG